MLYLVSSSFIGTVSASEVMERRMTQNIMYYDLERMR
jgi:hypothetical protein